MKYSPLTGRSIEAKAKLQSYLDWHNAHDSDPCEAANAARLKYAQHYWAVWENPRLLDDTTSIYQDADRRQPGLGDNLRAKDLQERFIQFNFSASRDSIYDKRDVYIFVWEQTQHEMGPYDIDPIRWVLRTRESVLKERDEFQLKLSKAQGWRDSLAVLDAFTNEKISQYERLKNTQSQWEEMLGAIKKQKFAEFLKEIDSANRSRAASSILRDSRGWGIER